MKFRVSSSAFRVRREVSRGDGVSFRLAPFTGHAAPAFTLIECLVYVSVFALVLVLAMQVFYANRDSSDRLRRNADDITRTMHAGERWREDVRSATAPPIAVEQDGHRWLAIPRGTNLTVYILFGATVWRQENTNAVWQPALARVKSSRMETDDREHVAAWRWEVELKMKDERARTRPLFTFLTVAPPPIKPESQP